MTHRITQEQIDAQVEHAGARAFGDRGGEVGIVRCPDCGHGIDPHGVDPGGPCGVGDESAHPCPCLMQPSGIARLLVEAESA